MCKRKVLGLIVFAVFLTGCGGNAPQKQAAPERPQATGVTVNLPHRSKGMNYHLDAIGPAVNPLDTKTVRIPSQEQLVSGWAIDEPYSAVAGSVDVAIDGVPYAARYGIARKDVAAFFKNPAYENSGFQFPIPASVLSPGKHLLTLRIVANDGKSFIESPAVTVIVQ